MVILWLANLTYASTCENYIRRLGLLRDPYNSLIHCMQIIEEILRSVKYLGNYHSPSLTVRIHAYTLPHQSS